MHAVTMHDQARALDDADGLAHARSRFLLPDGVAYLDGNSLGPVPAGVPARVDRLIMEEWRVGLIGSWDGAGWMASPLRVGDRIGRLIGAAPGEVAVCDSTSVNLLKVLEIAVERRPGAVVVEEEAFPTDRYIAAGVAARHGRELRPVPSGNLVAAMRSDVSCALIGHVDYRTAYRHDIAAVTAAARAEGVTAIWDLAHSAGAMPIDLAGSGVELAVGCGYKFLNGGPGAPAFVFVAKGLQAGVVPFIPGWLGHEDPFAMIDEYLPAPGIGRMLVGTPPMASLAALDAALDAFDGIRLDDVREKSIALAEFLIAAADLHLAPLGVRMISPRDPEQRGSHVALHHPQARKLVPALASRGVVGDYRDPGIIRLAVTPLYTRFADLARAVETLADLLAGS